MFYCQECGERTGWPTAPRTPRSRGLCEVCGKRALCYDIPSNQLPPLAPSARQEPTVDEDVANARRGLLESIRESRREQELDAAGIPEESRAIDRMAAVVGLARYEGETDERLAGRVRMAMRAGADDDELSFMHLTREEEQNALIMESTPHSGTNPLYEHFMELHERARRREGSVMAESRRENPKASVFPEKKKRRKNRAKKIPQKSEMNRFEQIRRAAEDEANENEALK